MPGRILLDTNIVIALFEGEKNVVQNIGDTREVFVSSVVLGELYYGAQKSSRVSENLDRLDDFALTTSVVFTDTDTARQYGQLKEELRRIGSFIPENDIWIAAHTRQHSFSLASRDEHFNVVAGIDLLMW